MCPHVDFEVACAEVFFFAYCACVFLSIVSLGVYDEAAGMGESFVAVFASIRAIDGVSTKMVLELVSLSERLGTLFAFKRSLARVYSNVDL